MTPTHHFEKISSRYHLKGVIEVTTALHVGSGRSGTTGGIETDSLVAKQRDGKPFIPGSSFRGVMRSTVERMVNSLGLSGIHSCLLFDSSGDCPTTNEGEANKIRELLRNRQTEQQAFNTLFNANQAPGALCATCRLFGSTFYASKLKVTDLPMCGDSPSLKVRDGVGIDRDRGAAVEGVKFNYEVVEKTQQFDLEIIGENLDETDLGLLAIPLLEAIDEHFWLGGNTSRGIGKIKLAVDDTLQIGSFTGPSGLRDYLKAHGTANKWNALNPKKGTLAKQAIEGWVDQLLSPKGGQSGAKQKAK